MKALFRQNKHLLFFLLAANLLHTFGHSVWRALFNNFAVEQIGVGADAIGWIQSVRELPGLLAFAVAFLALVSGSSSLDSRRPSLYCSSRHLS